MSFRDRITTLAIAAHEYALDYLRPARGERADARIAEAPWSDRAVYLLGGAANERTIANAIVRRNDGDFRVWSDLADEARRSFPALHSELATREQSVQETDFSVLPGEGSNQRAARRAADACSELLTHWQNRDESDDEFGSWDRWVAEFVGAAYYPLCAHEVMWARDERVVFPDAIGRIAERRLSYTTSIDDPRPWVPRICGEYTDDRFFAPPYGVSFDTFHPDKVLVHRRRVVGGHPASEGLFAVLVWLWLFQKMSWRDLMRLQEMLGVPGVIGYYAAGGAAANGAVRRADGDTKATSEQLQLARRTLEQMTGALRALLPDTVKLEPLKYDVPSSPVQLVTTERIDKLTARVVNGTDGVSSIVPGSRASQQVAAKQAMTPYRTDARYAARRATVLFARYIRANPDRFGIDCPLPYCVAHTDPPESPEAVARIILLAQRTGIEVPEAWAHRMMQVPVAAQLADGTTEPVLKPAQNAAPGGAAPGEPATTPGTNDSATTETP